MNLVRINGADIFERFVVEPVLYVFYMRVRRLVERVFARGRYSYIKSSNVKCRKTTVATLSTVHVVAVVKLFRFSA